MSTISVPVSHGELIDKITILEIKSARIGDPAKLANVRAELDLLNATWSADPASRTDITAERAKLLAVFCFADRSQRRTEKLDAVFVQDALIAKLDREI